MVNEHLEWFRFGDKDLLSAEHLMSLHPQPFEIICYLCQQSAEKYLKGFLIAYGTKPPKTHELDKLCDLCLKYHNSFEAIFDQCEVLSQYGVQPRYPHEIEILEHHAEKALAYAKEIKSFVLLQELPG